jgi:hypothetical protein
MPVVRPISNMGLGVEAFGVAVVEFASLRPVPALPAEIDDMGAQRTTPTAAAKPSHTVLGDMGFDDNPLAGVEAWHWLWASLRDRPKARLSGEPAGPGEALQQPAADQATALRSALAAKTNPHAVAVVIGTCPHLCQDAPKDPAFHRHDPPFFETCVIGSNDADRCTNPST